VRGQCVDNVDKRAVRAATDRVKKEKKTDMTGNTIPSTACRALLLLGPGGVKIGYPQASAERPLASAS